MDFGKLEPGEISIPLSLGACRRNSIALAQMYGHPDRMAKAKELERFSMGFVDMSTAKIEGPRFTPEEIDRINATVKRLQRTPPEPKLEVITHWMKTGVTMLDAIVQGTPRPAPRVTIVNDSDDSVWLANLENLLTVLNKDGEVIMVLDSLGGAK